MNASVSKFLCWKLGYSNERKMDDSLVSLIEIVLCGGTRTMLKEHRERLVRGKEGFTEEAFFEPGYMEEYSQVKRKTGGLKVGSWARNVERPA